MGNYLVRYKGAKVKGAMMKDAEDTGMEEDVPEEEAVEPKAKGKAKPFQPEKTIVANMLGKKKGVPAAPLPKAKTK